MPTTTLSAAPTVSSAQATPPVIPAPDLASPGGRWAFPLALVLVLALGVALRVVPSSGFPLIGYDESLYRGYTQQLIRHGPGHFQELVQSYMEAQANTAQAMLPPTRALFLLAAWAWHSVFGGDAFASLRAVSALAACLTLGVATGFGRRVGGRAGALAAAVLVGAEPLQIHLAQRGLIDGLLAAWTALALWALWECLQRPDPSRPGRWLWVYGAALAALVWTKENSLFVYVALVAALLGAVLAGWGRAGRPLWAMTVGAPAAGLVGLAALCGGFGPLWRSLWLFSHPPPGPETTAYRYAFQTGDGPWHRYLIDLVTLNPVLTVLALGGLCAVFALPSPGLARREDDGDAARVGGFLAVFVLTAYVLLHAVRFSFNLRHAAILGLPLCLLAFIQLRAWAGRAGRRGDMCLALALLLVALAQLAQYQRLFMDGRIYDPTPRDMLRVLDVLKG